MPPTSPSQNPLASLPQGPAFRFLDEVSSLEPGCSGAGRYFVRGDEAFLAGHFPGDPLVPGVILIEAVAQLAGVVAQCDPAIPPMADLRLAAVRTAKITGTAAPGATLDITAEVTGRLGPLIQAHGTVSTGGHLVLTTQIVLSGTAGVMSCSRGR